MSQIGRCISWTFVKNSGWKSDAVIKNKTITCAKTTKTSDGCKVQRDGRVYENTQEEIETRVGCECKKSTKSDSHVCKCRAPVETKKCDPLKNIESTVRASEVLVPGSVPTCSAKTEIVAETPVTCPQPVVTKGDCIHGFAKYTMVTQSPENCHCKPATRTVNVPCTCAAPKTDTVCVKGNILITSSTIETLKCEAGNATIPSCSCKSSHEIKSQNEVKCSPPKVTIGDCVNGKRKVESITYTLNDCKCVRQDDKKEEKCEAIYDISTKTDCEKMLLKGDCLVPQASALCNTTCGHNFKLEPLLPTHKNKSATPIAFKTTRGADLNILAIPKDIRDEVIVDKIPLAVEEDCLKKCQRNEACYALSINYELRICKLYHPTIYAMVKAGITTPLVKIPNTDFVELRPHLSCADRKIVELGDKHEIDILGSDPVEGETLCTQKLEIVSHVPSTTGSCEKEEEIVNAKCNLYDKNPSCAGNSPDCAFSQAKNNGTLNCASSKEIEFCPETTSTLMIERIKLVPTNKICVVEYGLVDTKTPCDPTQCPAPKKVVGECKNGVRAVYTGTYSYKKGEGCIAKWTHTSHSCDGCCPTVIHRMSPCVNGKRTLTHEFLEMVKNRCEIQHVESELECSTSCPSDETTEGVCVYGKKEVAKVFYAGKSCVMMRFVDEVKCSIEL
ncbi:hypothetical protein Ciccas_006831 [Cichlidogyrus casuarinus]|uniref:Uncharacterized protein n=1 Tax=Cichlidogyrus casuarinus TaxID=1844966 RepID=A0ABD2Q4P1_9PLAT